jgi:predicted ferric reductase
MIQKWKEKKKIQLFHLIKYKQWRCCIYTLVIFIVVGLYHIKLLKKKEVLFRKATYNIYKDITLIMSFGLVGTNCSARNFKRVFSGSSFKIYLFILQIAQLNKFIFFKKKWRIAFQEIVQSLITNNFLVPHPCWNLG